MKFSWDNNHLSKQINKCERHGEGTEENVGDGEVDNEDVPGCEHHLVGEEGQDDGQVTNHTQSNDDAVESYQTVVHLWL